MKYSEIIADNLSKTDWSWGCVSAIDSEGRTIWIADVHLGDGNRFVVHADELPTAFVELERAIYEFAVDRLDSVSAAAQSFATLKTKLFKASDSVLTWRKG